MAKKKHKKIKKTKPSVNFLKKKEEKRNKRIQMEREGIEEEVPGRKTLESSSKIVDVVKKESLEKVKMMLENKSEKKIIITTSRVYNKKTEEFAKDLENIFPKSIYAERPPKHTFQDVINDGIKHECTHIVLVGENNEKTNRLTIMCLPEGPTIYFKIIKIVPKTKIENTADATSHNPELLMHNFSTSLGKITESIFGSLFEPADIKGKQMAVFYNKRDFIFFRRYKYALYEKVRGVKTQEIGPRFTLRLMGVQLELYRKDLEHLWSSKVFKEKKKVFIL